MENVTRFSGSNGLDHSVVKLPSVAPAGRSTVQNDPLTPSGKSTTAATAAAPVEDALKNIGMTALEALLPHSILQSVRWMETEWAWRRVLFQESANLGEQKDLQVLWQLLDGLARGTSVETNSSAALTRIPVSQWPFSSLVLPYTQVDQHALKQLPAQVQPHVLADRMNASVQSPQYAWIGNGLFLLVAPSPSAQGTAVQWQAERQTKFGAMGQVIHRLDIQVQVGTDIVRISMLFSAPHLDLFFATDNRVLQEGFMGNRATLQSTLETMGVHVQRIHAGNLSDEE